MSPPRLPPFPNRTTSSGLTPSTYHQDNSSNAQAYSDVYQGSDENKSSWTHEAIGGTSPLLSSPFPSHSLLTPFPLEKVLLPSRLPVRYTCHLFTVSELTVLTCSLTGLYEQKTAAEGKPNSRASPPVPHL